MKKHLTVTYTYVFDKTASISFDRTNPDKHGFDAVSAAFKTAFSSQKFTVSDNPRYVLTMDYKYGYVISQYRMQYSNLTAQVLDLNNNKTVVATIVYDGKFELNPVASATFTRAISRIVCFFKAFAAVTAYFSYHFELLLLESRELYLQV